ncbi:MAG TPA: hypothetical protein VMF70_03830 [Gemmatimonadales bacterium]|nr:hypothetical protein [Gemmatimonadales bacterium]
MEPSPRFSWMPGALHLGQLARAGARWEVYLQSEPHPDVGAIRGRLHFVSLDRHRATAWIFLEWTAKEVVDRARQFSAVELWSFLEALAP